MSKRPRVESHGDVDEPAERTSGGHSQYRLSKEPGMPTNRPRLGRCAGTTAERPAAALYLVVDDWERGYGIHRVSDEDFHPDPSLAAAPPPIARVEAQHPHSWSFAAHGSKILAMLPPEYSPGIPVFDTDTMGMSVWPSPESRGDLGSKPLYISIGGRLLSFVYPFVEVLACPQPPPPTDGSWSWESVEPLPPFASSVVSGYAAHPDGRTLFVSVDKWRPDILGTIHILDRRKSTFTFDMERREWTHVGEWLLPFKGRAHYDPELDAWVGLCRYREGAGRVCCCDVPPAGGESTSMPAWKLGRDAFFDATCTTGHLGATLVYMGDSTFCVVQKGTPADCKAGTRTRVVKMTCFVLKYGKDGDLCTTRHRTYAFLSYEVAHERIDRTQNPVAFWM